MSELANVLTVAETDYLAECEERIERGLQTFVEVGTALAMIRDNKLYRATHGTFADYCEARWSIGRAHAYRMIDAAQAVSPIGDTDLPMPSNEAQARELARVPAAERVEVWRAATEATAGRPTAAAVRAAANPDQPAAKPVEADAQLDTPTDHGVSKADGVPAPEAGDGAGVLTGTPAPQTAIEGPGVSPSVDADGEGTTTDPDGADAAGDPTDRPSAGSPVNPLAADIAAAKQEARTSPSYVAQKAIEELKVFRDIVNKRCGGVDSIVEDLLSDDLGRGIASLWLTEIEQTSELLDAWRGGLRRLRLRSVQ